MKLLLALIVVGGLSGCRDLRSYQLRWTIGCAKTGDASCQIRDAKTCAGAGIDSIEVLATQAQSQVVSTFPCFSSVDGEAVGIGPALNPGNVELSIYGLSANGVGLTGPTELSIVIPATGIVSAMVNLPAPFACRDGVDNDGDGRVDLFDPDCKSPDGKSEQPTP